VTGSACATAAPPIRTAPSAAASTGAPASGTATVGLRLCQKDAAGTPLTQASGACQRAWRGYGITVVPPKDVLAQSHAVTLGPGQVTNHDPKVSAGDAVRAANGYISAFSWYIWAEVNKQPTLVRHLLADQAISSDEARALRDGADITFSGACAAPKGVALFAVKDSDRAFLSANRMPISAQQALIATYELPCTGTAAFADGQSAVVTDIHAPVSIVSAGNLVADPNLGDIWFTAGTALCAPSAPTGWCPS